LTVIETHIDFELDKTTTLNLSKSDMRHSSEVNHLC